MRQSTFIFLLVAIMCQVTCVWAQSTVLTARNASLEVHRPAIRGTLLTEKIVSTVLKDNRIGLDPNRRIKVYLPPGYASSKKSYPVVYYCHSFFLNADQVFEDGNLIRQLERGFANKVVNEFILVVADYSSPTCGSLYENSTTSGRWLDYTAQELIPFIDNKFRTLPHRNSRGLAGNFMGARGALKLAMTYPDIFSIVYALHPVATGTGYLPWAVNEVNWKKIHQAKTFAELAGSGREQIFVAVSQAFLPNPNRPPFYCDFWMELENGEPKLHVENNRKAQRGFLLDQTLGESAENLRKLRAIAFDWARYDPTTTHIYTNQEFTRKLEDLGIEHEAEEYRGNPWNKNWTDNGRFYARLLPFLAEHLVFEIGN